MILRKFISNKLFVDVIGILIKIRTNWIEHQNPFRSPILTLTRSGMSENIDFEIVGV